MASKTETAAQADARMAKTMKTVIPTVGDLNSLEITGLIRALLDHRKGLHAATRAKNKRSRASALAARKRKLEAELAKLS